MKVSVYQIISERDEKGYLFRDLKFVAKEGDGKVPSDLYACVYSGELPVTDPEQVFVICNCEHPDGYQGHSLSVSDVVEFQYDTGESKFFFCDSWGFPEIEFDKEKVVSKTI